MKTALIIFLRIHFSFFPLFMAFFLLTTISCSVDKDYSKSEIWKIAAAVEPDIEMVVPSANNPAVDCKDYGPGCLYGLLVTVKGLPATLVKFDSEKNAQLAARKIDSFYFHNWIFDDVTGEPVLEEFVRKAFKAKRVGE